MERTWIAVLLLSLPLGLAGAGCGDDDDDDDTSAGDGDADADADGDGDGDADGDVTCEEMCSFETECDPENNEQNCLDYCTCFVPLARPEFDAAVWACITASCAASEDGCFADTLEDIGPSVAGDEFEAACETRSTECADAFPNDYCYAGPLGDTVIGDMTACLADECDAIADCLGALTCPK